MTEMEPPKNAVTFVYVVVFGAYQFPKLVNQFTPTSLWLEIIIFTINMLLLSALLIMSLVLIDRATKKAN